MVCCDVVMQNRLVRLTRGRGVTASTVCLLCGGAVLAWVRSRRAAATPQESLAFGDDKDVVEVGTLSKFVSRSHMQSDVTGKRRIWRDFVDWWYRFRGFDQSEQHQQRWVSDEWHQCHC